MTQLIIDADTHLTEPPDVWTTRVPQRYLDEVPHVERNDEGRDVWVLDGTPFSSPGLTATARRRSCATSNSVGTSGRSATGNR
jgi:hypothetical protein